MAKMSIIVFIVICLGALIVHDVQTFRTGGRPWSGIIDGICGIFITPARNCIVAQNKIEGRRVTMNVSHRWRGNYQFRIWVPDDEDGNPPRNDRIGATFRFFDGTGKTVFEQKFEASKYSEWCNRSYGIPYGYTKSFWMYTAPGNVPLDKVLDVEIVFSGQIDAFLKSHSNPFIVLVKERDK